ncbi:F0F1 ATP synthase subunit delta [Micromonospora yasonensis]|uniref:F0F1 ATP synthase subunit delta n=1 Tax=Micromonospora yasonensis TaxID=1128667 RepID=UPI00222E295A|nr:F0F1 ATP synthase subunit delta [Micromonospora yasonensis]MCW3841795.1 F0F1 ATP synthase subunit delta [Micromonospora yasonensis]
MQAASRESYKVAAERLDAYARGAEPSAVASTADDILSVAALLRREPRLRRALSDPARSGEDRTGLLTGILSGKVGADALDLLVALVAGRWSAPSQLLDGAERLGVEALLASADKAGELGEVEDELFRFGQVVAGSAELSNALSDPMAPAERRATLADQLLSGKARPVTVRLVEAALAGFGGRSFIGALTRLVELAADRRDRQVAYVTVAAPLSDEEERRLGVRLSEMYGREVSVKQTVNPEVLGGVSVRVGSDLYDGTVLRRLNETRNALAKR